MTVAGVATSAVLGKVSPYLTIIRAALGVVLVAGVVYLLGRLVAEWVSMLLWGRLLIAIAVYMGALDTLPPGTSGWRYLWKGAGLLAMTYGVLLMVGAAAGTGNLLQPLRGLTGATLDSGESGLRPVNGWRGIEGGMQAATYHAVSR